MSESTILNSPYGEVKLNNEKIIAIQEKPKHKYFVNAGVYVLDPKCINLIPKKYFDPAIFIQKMILKNKD